MVKCTKGQEPWNPYWHCGIVTGSILGWVVVHCFLAEFVRLVRIHVAIFVVTFVRGGEVSVPASAALWYLAYFNLCYQGFIR